MSSQPFEFVARVLASTVPSCALFLGQIASAQCGWTETWTTSTHATWLGASVALDGDLALAGAPLASPQGHESGSAHLYDAKAGWAEIKTLLPSDPSAGKRFGAAVAMLGDIAFVGAPGTGLPGGNYVYVFERDQGGPDAWGETQRIGFGGGVLLSFGQSLAVERDTLVVGADYGSRAFVFRRAKGTSSWTYVRELSATDVEPFPFFGAAVAIHDDQIVVGAWRATNAAGVRTGAAYVFERDAGGPDHWGQVAKLEPADGVDDDRFGRSVAIGPSTLIVGAPQRADLAYNAGAAYVFERDPTGAWNLARKLLASDGGFTDEFGLSVALLGDEALVGAIRAALYGEAYVFERNLSGPEQWGERERFGPAYHPVPYEWFFGSSVALTPGRRLVGSRGTPGPSDAGLAYVYDSTPQVVSYCAQPSATLSGCSPRLSAIGCASASGATSFRILAHGLEARELAIFFVGASGRTQVPWGQYGASFCAQRMLQRSDVQFTAGTPGRCDGTASLDWNAFSSTHPIAIGYPFHAGQTINVQAVGRELATSTFSALSDALEFTLGP